MKYSAIIHLLIIYLALMTFYSGCTYLLGNLYGFILVLGEGKEYSFFNGAPLYVISGLLSLLLGWVILVYSKHITTVIVSKTGFRSQLSISADASQLLMIVLVFLALTSLLDTVPSLLRNIYYAFTEKAGALSAFQPSQKQDWFLIISRLLLPCLVIIFCRHIADYFAKNLTMDKVVISETIVSEFPESQDEVIEGEDENEGDELV